MIYDYLYIWDRGRPWEGEQEKRDINISWVQGNKMEIMSEGTREQLSTRHPHGRASYRKLLEKHT